MSLSESNPCGKDFGEDAPAAVVAMCVMLLLHGFFLDIIIIVLVPLFSEAKSEGSRKALFPWCLGGYEGFGGEDVANLAPCHRRFMTENAAYAIMRGGAGLFVLFMPCLAAPALMMAVCSHFVEAVTIAWEANSYGVPKDAAPPMTLMGIFSTWVMLTCHYNVDDHLFIPDDIMTTLYVFVGLTWAAWLWGLKGFASQGK